MHDVGQQLLGVDRFIQEAIRARAEFPIRRMLEWSA